jgi:hypothetical protein
MLDCFSNSELFLFRAQGSRSQSGFFLVLPRSDLPRRISLASKSKIKGNSEKPVRADFGVEGLLVVQDFGDVEL